MASSSPAWTPLGSCRSFFADVPPTSTARRFVYGSALVGLVGLVASAIGAPTPRVLASPVFVATPDAGSSDASADLDAGVPSDACTGAHLDLRHALGDEACATSDEERPIPSSIRVSVDQPWVTREGETAHGTLRLTNTSARSVELRLPSYCPIDEQVESEIRDRRGGRVDRVDIQCGELRGCGGNVVLLRLPPYGDATFAFDTQTDVRRGYANCSIDHVGAIPPGAYSVLLHVAFLRRDVRASLVIR